jgi:hypothetical protein
MRAVTAVV